MGVGKKPQIMRLKAGHQLTRQGERGNQLFLLLNGNTTRASLRSSGVRVLAAAGFALLSWPYASMPVSRCSTSFSAGTDHAAMRRSPLDRPPRPGRGPVYENDIVIDGGRGLDALDRVEVGGHGRLRPVSARHPRAGGHRRLTGPSNSNSALVGDLTLSRDIRLETRTGRILGFGFWRWPSHLRKPNRYRTRSENGHGLGDPFRRHGLGDCRHPLPSALMVNRLGEGSI